MQGLWCTYKIVIYRQRFWPNGRESAMAAAAVEWSIFD